MNSAYPWSRARLAINKRQNYFSLPDHQLAKDFTLCFWFLWKSHLHSRDILHRHIKPVSVLVSNSHYKSYKHEELEMTFGKKPINCKLGDLGEARLIHTQTNALTGKNCTTAVHRGNLAFTVAELIIEELSIASAGIDELKIVDLQNYAENLKCAKTKKDLVSTHSNKTT